MVRSVVVVDDQILMRQALVSFFADQPGYEVVGEAADGEEAVRVIDERRPTLALMDLQMPRMSGVEAIRILGRRVETRLVALTTFTTLDFVIPALRAGASGYLVKDCRPEELLRSLDLVVGEEDQLALSPQVVRLLVSSLLEDEVVVPSPPLRGSVALTEREYDVFRCLAKGLNNGEIAEQLFLSVGSVKAHVGRICDKLGVRDRLQAVIRGYELGLVDPRLSTRLPNHTRTRRLRSPEAVLVRRLRPAGSESEDRSDQALQV